MFSTDPGKRMRKGFTLVEMAVVLVIIGLIIGAIVVGQSLVGTTKVETMVKQVTQFDASMTTYAVTYNELPGDSPTVKWANGSAGNGNGMIEDGVSGTGFGKKFTGEVANFWASMSAEDITTTKYTATLSGNIKVGGPNPNVPDVQLGVPGTGVVVTNDNGDLTSKMQGAYLVGKFSENDGSNLAFSHIGDAFQPADLMSLDLKVDDGKPATGNVLAFSQHAAGNSTSCFDSAGTGYNQSYTGIACSAAIKYLKISASGDGTFSGSTHNPCTGDPGGCAGNGAWDNSNCSCICSHGRSWDYSGSGPGSCDCTGGLLWNPTTNSCDSSSNVGNSGSSGSSGSGNSGCSYESSCNGTWNSGDCSCSCPDGRTYDSDAHRCLCSSGFVDMGPMGCECPIGTVLSNGSCIPACPENSSWDGSSCSCSSGYEMLSGACWYIYNSCPPGDTYLGGGLCICPDGVTADNGMGSCTPSGSSGINDNECGSAYYNNYVPCTENGGTWIGKPTCSCQCPNGMEFTGSGCECPPGTYEDQGGGCQSGNCSSEAEEVDRPQCLDAGGSAYWDDSSCVCSCSDATETWNGTSCQRQCGPGAYDDGSSCQCETNYYGNPYDLGSGCQYCDQSQCMQVSNNQCVFACSSGQSCSGGVCQSSGYCGDGSCNNGEDCNSCSGDCGPCECPDPGTCTNGQTWDTNTCSCSGQYCDPNQCQSPDGMGGCYSTCSGSCNNGSCSPNCDSSQCQYDAGGYCTSYCSAGQTCSGGTCSTYCDPNQCQASDGNGGCYSTCSGTCNNGSCQQNCDPNQCLVSDGNGGCYSTCSGTCNNGSCSPYCDPNQCQYDGGGYCQSYCSGDQTCNGMGTCQTTCDSNQCQASDGNGGCYSTCSGTCNNGTCQQNCDPNQCLTSDGNGGCYSNCGSGTCNGMGSCSPNCDSSQCQYDAGGYCASYCSGDQTCNGMGTCQANCDSSQCEYDNNGTCTTWCTGSQSCSNGSCYDNNSGCSGYCSSGYWDTSSCSCITW